MGTFGDTRPAYIHRILDACEAIGWPVPLFSAELRAVTIKAAHQAVDATGNDAHRAFFQNLLNTVQDTQNSSSTDNACHDSALVDTTTNERACTIAAVSASHGDAPATPIVTATETEVAKPWARVTVTPRTASHIPVVNAGLASKVSANGQDISQIMRQLNVARDHADIQTFIENIKILTSTFTDLPESHRVAIPVAVAPLMESMVGMVDAPMLTDWICAISTLGFRIDVPRQDDVIRRALETMFNTSRRDQFKFAPILDKLPRMGVTFSMLNASQCKYIMSMVNYVSPLSNCKTLVMVLKALGEMGATWSTLPSDTTHHLWSRFQQIAGDFQGSLSSGAIQALGRIGFNLAGASEAERRLVFQVAKNGFESGLPVREFARLVSAFCFSFSCVA